MESIDVTLTKVCYHKPSKGNPAGRKFLIGKTSTGQTIMGEMDKPIEYDRYRLWGSWKPQKNYQDDAFVFECHEPIIEQSAAGIAVYLANYVDGLGPVKSRALTDEFGDDTLRILRETPEAASVVRGITPEIIETIRKHFAKAGGIDPVAYGKLIEMFAGHKVPRRVINSLLKDWGSDAPAKITERPYLLLAYPRLGWAIVDSFVVSVAKYPPEGIQRHQAVIVEALERIASEGHTYGEASDVEAIAFPLVNGRPTAEAWEAAQADELIAVRDLGSDVGSDDGPTVYCLPKLAEAEETIAYRLAELAATAAPLPFPLPDGGLLAGQREALRLIESNGVVIVAGAPGTGKTYCVTRALAGLVEHGFKSIRFVAPTGKAAKRAAELIERALPGAPIESSTVHRALGPVPSEEPEGVPSADSKVNRGRDEFGFSHNEDNPIESQVIVCDETSMLDAALGSNLLRAVANGTRLILVGDPNQLPSVGPGSVLRDLIAAGIPTATLTEVQRNCGTIVRACHDIMRGIVPTPARRLNLEAGENWIHIELNEPADIARKIVELHLSTKTFDPVWDMQVISPEKAKAGVGCDNLNRLLSDALNKWKAANRHTAPDEENAGFPPAFSCGDKVVRTKNGLCDLMEELNDAQLENGERPDWHWDGRAYRLVETDIVNGDMGDVVDICTQGDDTHVVVHFQSPPRYCRLPYGGSHLIQAYAMTCHKAQGSGFPYVILPVHNSFYMWNREMIYTMFSRAEKLLVTVGQASAIGTAVRRQTVNQRKTRLTGLVASALREPAVGAVSLGGLKDSDVQAIADRMNASAQAALDKMAGSLAGSASDPGRDIDF